MNIFDAVGNTPLFELNRVYQSSRGVKIFGKAEFLNPSGSVKDRSAKFTLLKGLADGRLKAGAEILDTIGGSTGISYCMMATQIGCGVTLCMPANVSRERKQIIETTAAEIWTQTDGKVNYFVTGTGTSGTFVGTARRFKELNPKIRGVLMQPDSPFHGLEGLRHIRTARHKGFFDETLVEAETLIRTEDAYKMTRKLAKIEGIPVGISAAANVLAAIEIAKSAPNDSVIVTILCDTSVRYLDEPIFNS